MTHPPQPSPKEDKTSETTQLLRAWAGGDRDALAAMDARKARVVELRFYGGLSVEESAAVLEISPETVMRDWKFARSWLQAELSRR